MATVSSRMPVPATTHSLVLKASLMRRNRLPPNLEERGNGCTLALPPEIALIYSSFVLIILTPLATTRDINPTSTKNGKLLAVLGSSVGGSGNSGGGTCTKTSAISTSSSVGFWAFRGAVFIATTCGSCIVLAGMVVFGSSSAGMDGTGALFTLANSTAFGFG